MSVSDQTGLCMGTSLSDLLAVLGSCLYRRHAIGGCVARIDERVNRAANIVWEMAPVIQEP